MDPPEMALEKAIGQLQLHSPARKHGLRITDLSDDIILSILELLCRHCAARKEDVPESDLDPESEHPNAIMNFSQTCFRFHRLARPYIFHHLYLSYDYLAIDEDSWEDDPTREESMLRLLATLAGDHARHAVEASKRSLSDGIDDFARSVKHLEVNLSPIAHIGSGETDITGIAAPKIWLHEWIDSGAPTPTMWWYDWLPALLNKLVNLEHLEATIERPLSKHHLFAASLDRHGLSRYESIKTLTLTYRGDCNDFIGNAYLRDMDMLFRRCPNMEVLEIRGIGGVGPEVMKTSKEKRLDNTGNLKAMRLTNCALQAADVCDLLNGVKGLETFVLSRGKFRRFQCMGEFSDRIRADHHPSCTPLDVVRLLRRHGNHTETLKHLELRPFELKMWQSFWEPTPPGGADEARQSTQAAVIDSLRDFTKLETLQLGQDSILGIPNIWLETADGSAFGRMGLLGPDGRFEVVSQHKLQTTILPDDGGTRLLDLLPRTLTSLRITNVNQYLAGSLLNFADAVASGEFPALATVSLHGESEAADRLRHAVQFRIESLRGVELDWPFLGKGVLESVRRTLQGAGVRFSWDAMDSNEPAGGWPGDTAVEFGWAPSPPPTHEELAFLRFSRERYERFCRLMRGGCAYGGPPGDEWASEPDDDEEYTYHGSFGGEGDDDEANEDEDVDGDDDDDEATEDEDVDGDDDGPEYTGGQVSGFLFGLRLFSDENASD